MTSKVINNVTQRLTGLNENALTPHQHAMQCLPLWGYGILFLNKSCSCVVNVAPDNKVHGANVGPSWGRQDPGGPHVSHMNLAIWGNMNCIIFKYSYMEHALIDTSTIREQILLHLLNYEYDNNDDDNDDNNNDGYDDNNDNCNYDDKTKIIMTDNNNSQTWSKAPSLKIRHGWLIRSHRKLWMWLSNRVLICSRYHNRSTSYNIH